MSPAISRSDLTRVVVAIDPAVTAHEGSDDTGIVVVARGPHLPGACQIPVCPGHGYVLADDTCHLLPAEWAKRAIAAYDYWQADRIVAEVNNGGKMVEATVRAIRAGVPYSEVNATRGKHKRAEPISALYEQGRVHHVGSFPELEQEMETWTQDATWSPNRLDALVWGLTHLGLVGGQGVAFLTAWKDEIANRKPGTPQELAHLPHMTDNEAPGAPEPGCQHRWQRWPNGDRCVFCGGAKPA